MIETVCIFTAFKMKSYSAIAFGLLILVVAVMACPLNAKELEDVDETFRGSCFVILKTGHNDQGSKSRSHLHQKTLWYTGHSKVTVMKEQ